MSDPTSEAATLRRRQDALRAQIARLDEDRAETDAPILVRIVDRGALPTTSPAMFAAVNVAIVCRRVEGATPDLTPGADADSFLVLNVGATAPPVDTTLIARSVGGHRVVAYD